MITFHDAVESATRYVDSNPPLTDEVRQDRILLHAVATYMRSHGATRTEVDLFIEMNAFSEVGAESRGWDRGWDAGYSSRTRQSIA